MSDDFFKRPILNSPYAYPGRHWELDSDGQPTNRVIETRRKSDLLTPVPKPKKQRGVPKAQVELLLTRGDGLSSDGEGINFTINTIRTEVEQWRRLPNPEQWLVTPETARLLQHWRHHPFQNFRPFFCQVEAVETAIWPIRLSPEVRRSRSGKKSYLSMRLANLLLNAVRIEIGKLAMKERRSFGRSVVSQNAKDFESISATSMIFRSSIIPRFGTTCVAKPTCPTSFRLQGVP